MRDETSTDGRPQSKRSVLVLGGTREYLWWETDFLREIIPIEEANWSWIPVVPPRRSRARQVVRLAKFAACLIRIRNGVLVFSSNELGYREVRLLVRLARPRVLVHLSDEWGTRPDYASLSGAVDLLVRQHHFGAYGEPANVLHMPLGYMQGMLRGRKSTELRDIPPILDRPHMWSFVGDPRKQDRQEALAAFASWTIGVRTENVTPAAMFDLYKRSVFVPSPRGNVRLDCFRLYEASLAGAIPVVAGSADEIADTFQMEGAPPWIIEDTWQKAVEKCRSELEQPSLLQDRQDRLLAWWRERVELVRLRISRGLWGAEP